MQVRLLRILQEKVYEPLGGTAPVQADVRVIAASNRSLEELVAQGQFRQDLYYRVNVVRLELPPLRDRKEDIPLLVDHFIARFNGLQGKAIQGISDAALGCLMAHDFPGNVRELENVIEHAFVLCREPLVGPQHLPAPLRSSASEGHVDAARVGGTLEEMERVFIQAALTRHGWNRAEAARELGIHRSTLRRRISALGIEAPDE
jgi:transcriptional regulator with PAS, ATPase and Fis domain